MNHLRAYDYTYLALVSVQLSNLYGIIHRQFALSTTSTSTPYPIPVLRDAKANRALLQDPFDDLD